VIEHVSSYEAVGGHATFARLVDRFDTVVADDPVLRATHHDGLTLPSRQETNVWH
jgi:truncated hemoglobin YjbI